ncbi:ABC transporter permease [Bacteroidota bacterium]
MIKNFFKTAIRNLFRQKAYSLINLLGLSIGIASFVIILIYVQHELSYDKFFKDSDRLYRVGLKYNIDGIVFYSALNPVPLAEGLKQEFPDIESVSRLYNKFFSGGYTYINYEDQQFREDKVFWVDSTVFDVLGIDLLKGNKDEALKNTNSVVITQETAKRYFGDDDPIGKLLKFDDGNIYNVTGVAKSFPVNSHLHFDFLASIHTNKRLVNHPDWIDVKNYVYLRLKDGVSIDQIRGQMHEFQKKYLSPEVKYITKLDYEDFVKKGNEFNFYFEPVTDIHLKTIFESNSEPQSDIKRVIIFGLIGIVILFIACINFINLTTAVATQRAKEVGIRKVVGSTRRLMLLQFLIEASLITLVSVILSFFIIEQFLPLFNKVLQLKLSVSILHNWYVIPLAFGLVLFVSLLAGFYPSVVLSSFKPVEVIKGKFSAGSAGRNFRLILVVLQYSISVLLIISTLVMYWQLNYMQKKPLGFNSENLIVIQRPSRLKQQFKVYKEIVDKSPYVISSTSSYGAPQLMIETMVYFTKGKDTEESYTVVRYPSDFDFIDTYGLEIIQGRKLDKNLSSDSTAVVLTETAVRAMGLKNPLEREIYYSYEKNVPLKVVGIVKDFHSESMHAAMRPTIIIINRDRPPMYYIIKYEAGKVEETIKFLEEKWNEFLPGDVLQYQFLEDSIQSTYGKEQQSTVVMLVFSILAIFIACLGLYGMSSYMANTRVKEIGIRKVLGANFRKITVIMVKDLLKWVLIANIIAWPIGFFIMNKWLQNYSYRIELGVHIFIIAGIISLLIAVITVGYQTIKASNTNPVDSLRYE